MVIETFSRTLYGNAWEQVNQYCYKQTVSIGKTFKQSKDISYFAQLNSESIEKARMAHINIEYCYYIFNCEQGTITVESMELIPFDITLDIFINRYINRDGNAHHFSGLIKADKWPLYGPFTQNVYIKGLREDDIPICDLSPISEDQDADFHITIHPLLHKACVQDNYITFFTIEPIKNDILANVIVYRDPDECN